MKQLAQQIRNELRTAHREQRDVQYMADNAEGSGLHPRIAGFYDGCAYGLKERRQVLGYLHLALRKALS